MTNYLTYFLIIVDCLLMIVILLQQRGTALGSAFGGESGGFYSTRRGIQQKIFWATIVLGIIFINLTLFWLTL